MWEVTIESCAAINYWVRDVDAIVLSVYSWKSCTECTRKNGGICVCVFLFLRRHIFGLIYCVRWFMIFHRLVIISLIIIVLLLWYPRRSRDCYAIRNTCTGKHQRRYCICRNMQNILYLLIVEKCLILRQFFKSLKSLLRSIFVCIWIIFAYDFLKPMVTLHK